MGQPASHDSQTPDILAGVSARPREGAEQAVAPARAAFLSSFRYAGQGVWYVVATQRNMRVHVATGVLVLLLAALLRLPPAHWAVLLLCMVVVLTLEMLNTVVEAVVDLETDRYHPLAKIAKDVAAGAVLVAAVGAALVGLLLLGPPLWQALGR